LRASVFRVEWAEIHGFSASLPISARAAE
jgi:hypothetical protein